MVNIKWKNVTLHVQMFENIDITKESTMSQNVHHLPEESMFLHDLVTVASR